MAFKQIESKIGFAELALSSSMDKNRTLNTLEQMNKVIDWSRIEKILKKYYKVGISTEGADAYPLLMLFKYLLLQKWFRIPSDPDIESQINDRISFKNFLKLPFGMPSPDHSTFSRFRGRLSKDVMDQINSEILRQFEKQGLTSMKASPSMPGSLNLQAIPSVMFKLKNFEIKEILLKVNAIKIVSPLSSPEILTRIGRSKRYAPLWTQGACFSGYQPWLCPSDHHDLGFR